jgi:uncharacterized surface protein with fasciclin (FAS1) repeats
MNFKKNIASLLLHRFSMGCGGKKAIRGAVATCCIPMCAPWMYQTAPRAASCAVPHSQVKTNPVGIVVPGMTARPTSATVQHDLKDIVDTAVAAGSFKTLAAALEAAGLIETLKGKGPFTVFAPTDEAFAKLPAGTVEALLKDKKKLTKILLYHVVAGNVMAKDVVKLKTAKTVQGSSVKITAKAGKVMVDKANVVKTDIETSNGVIHVIDSVILPK